MIEALKLIISRTSNPHVADQAMACIRALNAKSPITQLRYQQVLQMALANDTNWTPAERAILVDAIETPEIGGKTTWFRMRMTTTELDALKTSADAAGLSMSDYVRSKIF